MNALLTRQIKKYVKEGYQIPQELSLLIEAINRTYEAAEKDRELMERSLEISSQELREKNKELQKDYERQSLIIQRLQVTAKSLEENFEFKKTDEDELSYLVDVIDQLIQKRKAVEEELARKNKELKTTLDASVYRELRMAELKTQVKHEKGTENP